MSQRKYSYDSRCEDLAEVFLPPDASRHLKQELAQCIQVTIEDFLVFEADALTATTKKPL